MDRAVHMVGERLAAMHGEAPIPAIAAAASIAVRALRGDPDARRAWAGLRQRSARAAELLDSAELVAGEVLAGARVGGPHGGGGGHHGGGGRHGRAHHGHARRGHGGGPWGWGPWWEPSDLVIISDDEDAEAEDGDELRRAFVTAGEFDTSANDRFRTRVVDEWSGPTGRGAWYILRDRARMNAIRSPADDEPEWIPPYGVRGD